VIFIEELELVQDPPISLRKACLYLGRHAPISSTMLYPVKRISTS